MTKEFKVLTISGNTNAFGLRGVVMIAKDGEAWQVGSNDLNLPEKGQVIRITDDNFAIHGFEIPERLSPKAPPEVVDEVWR